MTSEPRNSVRWLASVLGVRLELLEAVDSCIAIFYRPFPVKRGTKIRQIDRPVGALKLLQTRMKDNLLATFQFPGALHGCVRGRSPMTNAREHCRPPLLASLDLANFYPSVTCEMVHAVWRDAFLFGPAIATLLTRLTTFQGHLPQGAPTSGYLANMVLLPGAERIKAVAAAMGCTATFYVDDMSISGQRARETINPVIDIIHALGLSIRHGKTKMMSGRVPQIVTGYTINSGRPSVPRVKRDHVRELIHELQVRRGFGHDVTKLEKSIRGRIAHIRRTNSGNAERLETQLASAVAVKPRRRTTPL